MLIKLSIRNAKRSWKNYLVFFLTLVFSTALIFSFFGLFFHMEILDDMKPLLYVATVLTVLVIAWLIQYMIRFMIRNRSREFATYLLLGMRRSQISRLFWGESLCLGAAAFGFGIAAGIFLQQFLFACFYSLIGLEYRIELYWDRRCFGITAVCGLSCYILALFLQRKKLGKMSIMELMKAQQKTERIREGNIGLGTVLFTAGLAYMLFFCWEMHQPNSLDHQEYMTGAMKVTLLIAGLVIAVYVLYTGLASLFCLFIRTGHSVILKGNRVFLLRQLSSKIRTVRFTCGTLTILFTLALMGCSAALMINDYRDTQLLKKYPFTVNIVDGAEHTMEAAL